MNLAKASLALSLAFAGLLALAGCASPESFEGGAEGAMAGGPLVIGSQDYYSNEIVAETYAQALESAGFEVERDFRIGQREVYLPELEAGSIDVFPEYTGNLLQYYDPEATVTEAAEVHAELSGVLPVGVRALAASAAADQDSYIVAADFAASHGVGAIGDLAGLDGLVLGGNSELERRPYGPEGLAAAYGVSVGFTPIEDSGGPLTLKALRDGQIQIANIYSASPALASGDFVVLADPAGLFLASNVVPIVSARVDEEAAAVLDAVSAAMTSEDLVAMNAASVEGEKPASEIAAQWLAEKGIQRLPRSRVSGGSASRMRRL